MSIDFGCPECGTTIHAPEDRSGRSAKCAKCGAVVVVPMRDEAVPRRSQPDRSKMAEYAAYLEELDRSKRRKLLVAAGVAAGIIMVGAVAWWFTRDTWEAENHETILSLSREAEELKGPDDLEGAIKEEKPTGEENEKQRREREKKEDEFRTWAREQEVKRAKEQFEEKRQTQDKKRRTQTDPAREIRTVVDDWLRTQEQGEWGKDYWLTPGIAVKFFAVRGWKILKIESENAIVWNARIRIESSTKGGFPIIKIWTVKLVKSYGGKTTRERWKILKLSEE